MVIKPVSDNIVIKKKQLENKTKEGIFLGSSATIECDEQGTVIAVGSGRLLANGERVKSDIKPGDQVLFNKFAGSIIEDDGEEYLILKENDILAVIE